MFTLINQHSLKYYIKCDYLIRAIGSHPDSELLKKLPIRTTKQNKIYINSHVFKMREVI